MRRAANVLKRISQDLRIARRIARFCLERSLIEGNTQVNPLVWTLSVHCLFQCSGFLVRQIRWVIPHVIEYVDNLFFLPPTYSCPVNYGLEILHEHEEFFWLAVLKRCNPEFICFQFGIGRVLIFMMSHSLTSYIYLFIIGIVGGSICACTSMLSQTRGKFFVIVYLDGLW